MVPSWLKFSMKVYFYFFWQKRRFEPHGDTKPWNLHLTLNIPFKTKKDYRKRRNTKTSELHELKLFWQQTSVIWGTTTNNTYRTVPPYLTWRICSCVSFDASPTDEISPKRTVARFLRFPFWHVPVKNTGFHLKTTLY